jgi:DNA-directed RNA polymerase specialized sigma24 family protein
VDLPAPPRDDGSFRDFYQASRRQMMGLVRWQAAGQVKDHELITEEAWHRFYPHWRNCADPQAYLRRCMVNETNRALRKARREPQILCIDDAPASALAATGRGWRPSGGAPEEAAWDPEVVSALARLSDRLRAAALLDTELEPGQRSVVEIAQILGISRVAAAMRLARAYTQLRELLTEGYPELRRARRRDQGGLEGSSAT